MAIKRTISVAGINIRVHRRHSSNEYISLLRDAQNLDRPIRVFGDQYLFLWFVRPIKTGKPMEGLEGQIAKFTDIDLDSQWFNIAKHKPADRDEIKSVNIPKELRPNFSSYRFVFFLRIIC